MLNKFQIAVLLLIHITILTATILLKFYVLK